MLNIYIIRHGQDTDNACGVLNGWRDNSLTAQGRQQAKTMGQALKKKGIIFEALFISPLKRAQQTAKIINQSLGIKKIATLKNLIERDMGIMTGKKLIEIDTLCTPHILRTKQADYFLQAYGAETFPQTLARARQVLSLLRKEYRTGNILIVTHGDLAKMMFAAYYKLPWQKVLGAFYFNNAALLILSKDIKPGAAYQELI